MSQTAMTPWTLLRKSGPQQRAVTLSQAKQTLRLSQTDTSHDADLLEAIDAATEQVEHDIDGACIDQEFTYFANAFPSAGQPMALPKHPVSVVSEVAYIDSDGADQVLDVGTYLLDEGRRQVYLVAGESWPSTQPQQNAVTVTFTAGYGATIDKVPRLLKRAILIQVGRWFYDPGGEQDGGKWETAYDNIIQRVLASFYVAG